MHREVNSQIDLNLWLYWNVISSRQNGKTAVATTIAKLADLAVFPTGTLHELSFGAFLIYAGKGSGLCRLHKGQGKTRIVPMVLWPLLIRPAGDDVTAFDVSFQYFLNLHSLSMFGIRSPK